MWSLFLLGHLYLSNSLVFIRRMLVVMLTHDHQMLARIIYITYIEARNENHESLRRPNNHTTQQTSSQNTEYLVRMNCSRRLLRYFTFTCGPSIVSCSMFSGIAKGNSSSNLDVTNKRSMLET